MLISRDSSNIHTKNIIFAFALQIIPKHKMKENPCTSFLQENVYAFPKINIKW